MSNAGIAERRVLTLGSVEKHASEIFSRLGIQGDAAISRRVRATLIHLESTAS